MNILDGDHHPIAMT